MKGRGPIVRPSGAVREPAAGSRSPVQDFQLGSWRSPFGRSVFDVQPFWRGEIGWGKAPAVDSVDKGSAYEITAELPGMDESNIDVKFSEGTPTIKGEKGEEKEEKKKEYYLCERRYDSFQRSFGCRTASMPTRSRRTSRTGCSRSHCRRRRRCRGAKRRSRSKRLESGWSPRSRTDIRAWGNGHTAASRGTCWRKARSVACSPIE
jgi:HSP20 family molecular chaperone IbpA